MFKNGMFVFIWIYILCSLFITPAQLGKKILNVPIKCHSMNDPGIKWLLDNYIFPADVILSHAMIGWCSVTLINSSRKQWQATMNRARCCTPDTISSPSLHEPSRVTFMARSDRNSPSLKITLVFSHIFVNFCANARKLTKINEK